jgi:WW domain-containing oxidoreductase
MAKSSLFGARSTADQVIAGIDLSNKHMLVTGCSSGLGFETMSALAANGAHVIGIDHSYEQARNACLKAGYLCTPLACDLSDFDSISAAARQIHDSFAPLDAIVANAGIANLPVLSTRYSVERQFLVNYLGHFALLNGLSDVIRDGSGRVVIVGDHTASRHLPPEGIMFDNLAGQRFYRPETFYAQAKLANVLHAKELARRLRSRSISVNVVNPGAVRGTGLHRHDSILQRLRRLSTAVFSKLPAQGAATSVFMAASPTVAGVTAEQWHNCKSMDATAVPADADLARRLWAVSEQIIGGYAARPEALRQKAA